MKINVFGGLQIGSSLGGTSFAKLSFTEFNSSQSDEIDMKPKEFGLDAGLQLGLDYIFISPIKNVVNKNPALGWEKFSKLAKLFPGPSFALGGLKQADLKIAKENGAQGIAGISGFFQSSE